MKRKITSILVGFLIFLLFTIPVFAENSSSTTNVSHPLRLIDEADLLTNTEEKSLLTKLNEISETQEIDVIVVTINSLDGKNIRDYADDYYDYNGYGMGNDQSGILLLLSMDERKWWMSTSGAGISIFTDAGLDYISEQFLPDMSDGNYADSFETYATLCNDFITKAKADEPYDNSNLKDLKSSENFLFQYSIIISLVVGIVLALIITGVMRSKLKSVHSQVAASNYIKENSLKITERYDHFLYRHVSRRARPKEDNDGGSSTHTSSSGNTHGGSGGSF